MQRITGACHCGNIRLEIELSREPAGYRPRACDCDFCRKHRSAYVSDPHGSLVIHVRDSHELGTYRQGNELAEMLLCRGCGVLVGALFRADGQLFATVNVRAAEEAVVFGSDEVVSPRKLTGNEKTARWKALWFADVRIQRS